MTFFLRSRFLHDQKQVTGKSSVYSSYCFLFFTAARGYEGYELFLSGMCSDPSGVLGDGTKLMYRQGDDIAWSRLRKVILHGSFCDVIIYKYGGVNG